MSSIEIKCPQPTRPLKRKASQFDPFDDTNDEQTASKRRNPRWDAENKAAKVRRSSQIDTVSSLESSFGLNGDLDNDVRGGNR